MNNKFGAVSISLFDSKSLIFSVANGGSRVVVFEEPPAPRVTLIKNENKEDSAVESSPESLGCSDDNPQEFNMNIRETDEEVIVDLFGRSGDDGDFDPCFFYDSIVRVAYQVVYEVTRDRALLAYNASIMGATRAKMARLVEEHTEEVAVLMDEYVSTKEKYDRAVQVITFLQRLFDPLSRCIDFHLNAISEDIRADVRLVIDDIIEKESELLYGDHVLKRALRETYREGSGAYYAARQRDTDEDNSDGLRHMGVGVMPEPIEKKDRRIIIPYLRNPEGEVITYKVSVLNKDPKTMDKEKYVNEDRKALAIYVSMKVGDKWSCFPIHRAYQKYVQRAEYFQHLAASGDWPRFQRERDKYGYPIVETVKHIYALSREVRDMIYNVSYQIQDDLVLWGWRHHKRPSRAVPQGKYVFREMELFGKKALVFAQIV